MMKLYDDVIKEISALLSPYPCRKIAAAPKSSWKDAGGGSLVLRGDMAYELGGSGLPAVGGTLLTTESSLVPEDEILLYGKDLGRIQRDTAYARLAFVRVREDCLGEGNALYEEIRRMEYTRYHVFPEGFMMRISAASEREQVRIGRSSLRKGLGFAQPGRMFSEAYHRNPKVEAVKLIFITLSDFPYPELERQVKKAEQITKAIDHILKNLAMDCGACSLKQICDEVEGMKELHFGTANRSSS